MDHIEINQIEKFYFDNLSRIVVSDAFKSDLVEIEKYIIENYQNLHYHWGIKNKIKLAAERLVRFHVWKSSGLTELYRTPLSSDVAFYVNDCVLNVDCKTIDLNGNRVDSNSLQCEPNQANFENKPLYPCEMPNGSEFEGFKYYPMLEKYSKGRPVLSYFISIIYEDDGSRFNIDRIELVCLPHHEIVKNQFNSDIISNFKTYDYLDEKRATKFGEYFLPRTKIDPQWEEIVIGRTVRFLDSSRLNPITNEPLIWGFVDKKYKIINGGHTIRINKNRISNRTINGSSWQGHKIFEY